MLNWSWPLLLQHKKEIIKAPAIPDLLLVFDPEIYERNFNPVTDLPSRSAAHTKCRQNHQIDGDNLNEALDLIEKLDDRLHEMRRTFLII